MEIDDRPHPERLYHMNEEEEAIILFQNHLQIIPFIIHKQEKVPFRHLLPQNYFIMERTPEGVLSRVLQY